MSSEDAKKKFYDNVNKAIGNKSVASYKYVPSKATNAKLSKAPMPIVFRMAAQSSSKTNKPQSYKPPKKTAPPVGKKSSGSGKKSASAIKRSAEKKDQNTRLANVEFRGAQAKHEDDKPMWQKILGAVERPLDVISRPSYAMNEGLRNTFEGLNEGKNPIQVAMDAASGAGAGITGKKKTGFGDVLEEQQQYDSGEGSKSTTGNIFNTLFKQLPGVEEASTIREYSRITDPEGRSGQSKWANRLVGAAGEVYSDPTTYLSGGVATVAKSAAGKAGRDAVESSIKTIVRRHVDDSFLNHVPKAANKGAQNVRNIKLATAGDNIIKDVETALESTLFEVRSGALNGKVVGNTSATKATIAQQVTESVRNEVLAKADKHVADYESVVKAAAGGPISLKDAKRLAAKSQNDEFFKEFYDAADSAYKVANNYDDAIKAGRDAMVKRTQQFIDDFKTKLTQDLVDDTMRIPTLRFMGKDMAQFPRLGKAGQVASRKFTGTIPGAAMKRQIQAFNYAGVFHGATGHIGQKVRSLGNVEYEKFHKGINELAKTVSKDDRKIIHNAIHNRTVLSPELEKVKQQVLDAYEEIWKAEIAAGVRSVGDLKVDNYTFSFIKGNPTTKTVRTLAGERKTAIKTAKGMPDKYGPAGLKADGFRIEEDVFKNLLYRKMKSVRDVNRVLFKQDLIDIYGIKARIPQGKAFADQRNLTRVDDKFTKKKVLKPGEEVYLDKDIQRVYDEYVKMTATTSDDSIMNMLKTFDWLTRKFKVMNTVYFPGFHVRNMISDMFFGMMDGVKMKWYKEVFTKYTKRDKLTTKLNLGGRDYEYNKVLETFKNNTASGGFFASDVLQGGVGDAAELLRTPSTIARGFSEKREDFGRFVHFVSALDDELYAQTKKAGVDPKLAYDRAVFSAVERVNKYKIDYGALTSMESQVMRRVIPFYTYMRKAIPVILQTAYLNPKYLSYTNKLMESGEPMQDMLLPDYLRELSYAVLPWTEEGEEPIGFTNELLPQNLMNDVMNPRNFASRLNPLIQGVTEMRSGYDTFANRKLSDSNSGRFIDIILNKARPVGTFLSLTDKEKSGIEKLGQSLGIPIKTNTKERQEVAYQQIRAKLREEVQKLSKSLESSGYSVYQSDRNDGNSFRIKDLSRDEVVAEYETWDAMLAGVERYRK